MEKTTCMRALERMLGNSVSNCSPRPLSQPVRNTIQANFLIARPPPKSLLCVKPKLLFQIQQLSHNDHPRPVLEVWRLPFCRSKLTSNFYHSPKLRSGDIYATSSEPYVLYSDNFRQPFEHPREKDGSYKNARDKDIVALVCHPAHDKYPASIYFRDIQIIWKATAGIASAGKPCYRFQIDEERGSIMFGKGMIMQWEKRPRAGKVGASTGLLDSEHFVLCLIDHGARLKGRIATMTRGQLDISVCEISMMEYLQYWLDSANPVPTAACGRHSYKNLETWLYTHVLTLGTWVANQEGWLDYQ